jgi:hypothetical protein
MVKGGGGSPIGAAAYGGGGGDPIGGGGRGGGRWPVRAAARGVRQPLGLVEATKKVRL